MGRRRWVAAFWVAGLLLAAPRAHAQEVTCPTAPEDAALSPLLTTVPAAYDASVSCRADRSTIGGAAAQQIDALGGGEVSAIPVRVASGDDGSVVANFVVWRVDGADGSTHWVDDVGRVYASWADWIGSNKLPAGTMTYPAGGGCLGFPQSGETPAASFGARATQVLDVVATVGGVVLIGAAIVGTGGLIIPVAVGALAVYGLVRSGGDLVDRAQHWQTINPLQDPQAFFDWVGVGTSVLGVASSVRSVFGVLRPASVLLSQVSDVNAVGGKMNCVASAISADKTMTGAPTQALKILNGVPLHATEENPMDVLKVLRLNYSCPDCGFNPTVFNDARSIEQAMQTGGSQRALLLVANEKGAHMLNVVVQDGVSYAVDAQSRTVMPLARYVTLLGKFQAQYFPTDVFLHVGP